MRHILADLYHGRITPWERPPIHNEEEWAVGRRIEEETRYFVQKMSPEDCQRFQALEDLYTESSGIAQVNAFSHGFKLGVELMTEVFATQN